MTTEKELKEAHENIMAFAKWVKANPQIVEKVKKEIAEEDAENEEVNHG